MADEVSLKERFTIREDGTYDYFWIGFKKYMRTHHPQAPESFVDAKEYHDRRNWFNTYIGAKIDEGWFDLNYTYQVVYEKMVKWMVALADVLNRLTTTIKYRKKEDFDINTLK